MRAVRDEDVDRAQVYRRRRHSRALLIARKLPRIESRHCRAKLLPESSPLVAAWRTRRLGRPSPRGERRAGQRRQDPRQLLPRGPASSHPEQRSYPGAPMVLRKRESRALPPSRGHPPTDRWVPPLFLTCLPWDCDNWDNWPNWTDIFAIFTIRVRCLID